MQCINDAGQTTKTWKNAPTLFFKFAGTQSSVKEQVSQVQGMAKKAGSVSFEFAKSEQEKEDLWQARKEALWSVMAKGEGDPEMGVWTTDVAVPISKLPQIIEETKEQIRQSGLLASIVGHVGDGNFHCKPILSLLFPCIPADMSFQQSSYITAIATTKKRPTSSTKWSNAPSNSKVQLQVNTALVSSREITYHMK
jgi:FAD/FMN-containing dehydrogenase